MLWKTSPSATELEEVTIDWTRKMMGLPPDFSGVIYDTASISTLCAIAAAREAVPDLRIREEGIAAAWAEAASSAPPRPKRLRLYASEHVHSSVDKAAIILGIGQAGVRKIPTDEEFRMDARALEAAIEEDKSRKIKGMAGSRSAWSPRSGRPLSRVSTLFPKSWKSVSAIISGCTSTRRTEAR